MPIKLNRIYNNNIGHEVILGLQPRDKAAMLVVNTKEIFLLNLHQNRVHFPAERNAFVLDHQHGRRDVTCKPAINNVKTFLCQETRAKCTLCNEITVATNNIGHKVKNNTKTFSCRETRAKCIVMQ